MSTATDLEAIRLQMLVDTFNRLFAERENTRLVGGADEPFYQPADADCDYHRLYFREDFFSSALHEIAHWCIAGAARRKLPDFGYWYEPEGRTAGQQRDFEQVEIRPQALEWHLSVACKQRFRVSADNISAGIGASEQFLQDVSALASSWCDNAGMPPRGRLLQDTLAELFAVSEPRNASCYDVEKLR